MTCSMLVSLLNVFVTAWHDKDPSLLNDRKNQVKSYLVLQPFTGDGGDFNRMNEIL